MDPLLEWTWVLRYAVGLELDLIFAIGLDLKSDLGLGDKERGQIRRFEKS